MYRELASLDAFGVPGGPYTGAPRSFAWQQLPPAVIERLVHCVAREELPTPLLVVSRQRRSTRRVLMATALGVLPTLSLAWSSPWMLPTWLVGFCAVVGGLAGYLVQQALRKDKLDAGLYLFPLDIVEARPDSLRVSPMGSLQSAGIRRQGTALWLELRFRHGATYRFGCPDEASAERAYQKICEAHAAVERLTFRRDLEETVDLDPFFAIRGEDLWTDATDAKPQGLGVRELGALAAGALSGVVLFAMAYFHTDDRLYRDAFANGSQSAYLDYLQAGGRLHAAEARARLERLRIEASGPLETPQETPPTPIEWRHRSDAQLGPEQAAERHRAQQDALDRYVLQGAVTPGGGARPLSHDVSFATVLPEIFAAAQDHGDDGVYLVLPPDLGPETPARAAGNAHGLALMLDAGDATVLRALGAAFAARFPQRLLTVARLDEGLAREHPFVIRVNKHLTIHDGDDLSFVFDVYPQRFGETRPGGFQLVLPAPKHPLAHVRFGSLFAEPDVSPPARTLQLLTARAYDRLYDELYGLFFLGDPQVPLRATDAEP